jgi:hypothetical protein
MFLLLGLVRKLRCDGEKPTCYHCTVRPGAECIYELAQRRRGPGKARKGSRSKKVGHRPSTVVAELELDAMPPEIQPYMTVLHLVEAT